MCETEDNLITEGQYVVVKKLKYKKLYKVAANGMLILGKDQIMMQEIIGKRFWSTFAMVPIKAKRSYFLKEVKQKETVNDLLSELPSGSDNRTILDDGMSQKLSKEEIDQLQESGKSGKEIIGSLIENNKSFLDRTEYSQEKYLKKKEQKYLKYITICKPSISLLHDVYFKVECSKLLNLRMDTLAQMLSYSDVQSDGLYMLYDSGTLGLSSAAMLHRIGANTEGQLIALHPGYVPSRCILNAMNFPTEQLDRLIHINIYSFLRLYYQGEIAVWDKISHKKALKNEYKRLRTQARVCQEAVEECFEAIHEEQIGKEEMQNAVDDLQQTADDSEDTAGNLENAADVLQNAVNTSEDIINEVSPEETKENISLKRKLSEMEENEAADEVPPKKPKWLLQTIHVVDLVKSRRVNGLVIIAKEHPTNIIVELLPFLGASRPFVIYHPYREPLQETYMTLKQQHKVANLKLFSNFLRSYQVLPDRTHPDILTSGTGGYLLTGYLVEE